MHFGDIGIDKWGNKDLHTVTVTAFKNIFYTGFYIISMIMLAFHLRHGVESAFQTLGLNTLKYERTISFLGKGIAVGRNKDFYKSMGKKYLNRKSFPYGNKINFNSLRKGEVIGEHEVKFSSGKEIITLNHEAFDRALYSEGALTAAKWLMNKKPGLYSMRNLLNFK